MICPYCGKELDDNAQFCVYCGKKLLPQDKNANVKQNNAPQNNIQNNATSQNSFQNNSNAQNGASYSPFNSKQNQTQGAYGFGKNFQSANGFRNQIQGANVYGNQVQASSNGTVTLQQNPKKKMMIIIIAVLIAVFAFLLAAFLFTSPKARAARQLKLGEQYLKEQKYEDAIAAFNASIKIDNKNIKPYEGLVTANKALNQYDEAADSMEQAITNIGLENIPDNDITELVDSYTVIASNAESSGDTEKAKKCYDRILELDPDNKDAKAKSEELANKTSQSEFENFAKKLREEKGDLAGKTVEMYAEYGDLFGNGAYKGYWPIQNETPDDANGILAVATNDFDGDGQDEILAISQELDDATTYHYNPNDKYDNNIIASIYKENDNEYQLQESYTIGSYEEDLGYDIKISYKLTKKGILIFMDNVNKGMFYDDDYIELAQVTSYDGETFSDGYKLIVGSGPDYEESDIDKMISYLKQSGINCNEISFNYSSVTEQDPDLIILAEISAVTRSDYTYSDTDIGVRVYADKTYTDLTQSNGSEDNSNDTSSDEAQSSEAVPDGTALTKDGYYHAPLVSKANAFEGEYVDDVHVEGNYLVIKGALEYSVKDDLKNANNLGEGVYYVKFDSNTVTETGDEFSETYKFNPDQDFALGSGVVLIIYVKNGVAAEINQWS